MSFQPEAVEIIVIGSDSIAIMHEVSGRVHPIHRAVRSALKVVEIPF